jgi:hypothetical protein
MTTTSEATKKIKITMSERRPLSIDPEQWPVIAQADWHDGRVECQANNIMRIKVREHADGRRIVYGFRRAGDGGQHAGTRNPEAGFLLSSDAGEDETIRALRRVGGVIDDDRLAEECIADLPAEEVDVAEKPPIKMPREGAVRLLRLLDDVATSGPTGIDPRYARDLAAVADELRKVLGQ